MGTSSESFKSSTIYSIFKMSANTAVNTFNKSKEDFIWFVKKAVQDKKSFSHSELYHSLLKIFVDADTNKDGLVSKASFSKPIDEAATMPRAYGFAPADADLYKTEAEKDAARQKMFDSMDLKSTGVITFDEWLKFCRNTLLPRPQPCILIPSLTKEVSMSTRSSSRKLPPTQVAPRRLSCIGICWRSSQTMTLTRMVSLSWPSSMP